jgi:hypothetical protein
VRATECFAERCVNPCVQEASTVGALKRAVTTSFGSVCFGSLILSFLQVCWPPSLRWYFLYNLAFPCYKQAVEWIMEKARRQQQFDAATQAVRNSGAGRLADVATFGNCGGPQGQLLQCFNIIGACLLRLVRQAMEYCTAYAFAAVSIYGLDFKC